MPPEYQVPRVDNYTLSVCVGSGRDAKCTTHVYGAEASPSSTVTGSVGPLQLAGKDVTVSVNATNAAGTGPAVVQHISEPGVCALRLAVPEVAMVAVQYVL